MVRFARARGSKGANERQPEAATPWKQMKQQVLEAQEKKGDQSVESAHYSSEEDDESENTTWAKFEETEHDKKTKRSLSVDGDQNSNMKKKKKTNNVTENKTPKKKTNNVTENETPKKKTNNATENKTPKYKINNPAENKTPKKMKFEKKNVANGNSNKKLTRQQKEQNGLSATPRKPLDRIDGTPYKISIGTREVDVVFFQGFTIKKVDYERIIVLQKKLKEKNIPKEQLESTLKSERRRAEKALARERKKVCFNCRETGHLLSECPTLNGSPMEKKNTLPDTTDPGVCYKCGSMEHSQFECKIIKSDNYKFATCFICKEQGHISRQCPDNPQGVYPKGGACNLCGEVTHLRRQCPKSKKEKSDNTVTLPTLNDTSAVEALDSEAKPVVKKTPKKKKNVVKF